MHFIVCKLYLSKVGFLKMGVEKEMDEEKDEMRLAMS